MKRLVEVVSHPAGRSHSTESVVRKWVRKHKAVYLNDAKTKALFLGHLNRVKFPNGVRIINPGGDWNGEDLPTHPQSAINTARFQAERKAREANAIGCHSQSEWEQIVEQHENRCLRCGIHGKDTYLGRLTKDHIVPLVKGGTDFASNLQPLCRRCNSWKHDKEIDFRHCARPKNIVGSTSAA